MSQHKPLKDKDYDLVSTLYHALQGIETTDVYIEDAQKDGDEATRNFLEDTQKKYREISARAKELLAARIS